MQCVKGAITGEIKYAIKHKTSPARLAQLLQPSLGRPEPPFRTGLCFTADVFFFYFFRHAFSEIPLPIAMKLCHMIGIWLSFIN